MHLAAVQDHGQPDFQAERDRQRGNQQQCNEAINHEMAGASPDPFHLTIDKDVDDK